MDRIHTFDVAGVEGVVALLHEREKVCRAIGVLGRGGHDGSFSLVVDFHINVAVRIGNPRETLYRHLWAQLFFSQHLERAVPKTISVSDVKQSNPEPKFRLSIS